VTADEPGLPAETSVGRVALDVADLDRLVEFYTAVVGLDVRDRTADRAVLGAGDTPLFELDREPERPARTATAAGLFHTAVRVPSRAALGDALVRIESQGALAGASDHRVSEALYLRDPEDNGIEVYCDRPRTEWPTRAGRVAMDTRPLDLDALRTAAGGADRVPPGTDVGHVHLEVTDLAATRSFYVDTLGLGVRQEVDGALFLAAGDYHHHVGLNTWNGRSTVAAGRGLDWFELHVPAEALPTVRRRLDEAGVDVAGSGVDIAESGTGFAVEDPDGIGIRIEPC
jgi:catechol 2,3-dioxygenase